MHMECHIELHLEFVKDGSPGIGRIPFAKCCDLKKSCTMWLDSSVVQSQICRRQNKVVRECMWN